MVGPIRERKPVAVRPVNLEYTCDSCRNVAIACVGADAKSSHLKCARAGAVDIPPPKAGESDVAPGAERMFNHAAIGLIPLLRRVTGRAFCQQPYATASTAAVLWSGLAVHMGNATAGSAGYVAGGGRRTGGRTSGSG